MRCMSLHVLMCCCIPSIEFPFTHCGPKYKVTVMCILQNYTFQLVECFTYYRTTTQNKLFDNRAPMLIFTSGVVLLRYEMIYSMKSKHAVRRSVYVKVSMSFYGGLGVSKITESITYLTGNTEWDLWFVSRRFLLHGVFKLPFTYQCKNSWWCKCLGPSVLQIKNEFQDLTHVEYNFAWAMSNMIHARNQFLGIIRCDVIEMWYDIFSFRRKTRLTLRIFHDSRVSC